MTDEQVKAELIRAARHFYDRGWMAGTAGNLSARTSAGAEFWITASGRAKGNLGERDFVEVNLSTGSWRKEDDDARPSAETGIHSTLYRLFPDARACYHVHTIESNIVARLGDEVVSLPPLEMLKGLGIPDEAPAVSLPIFTNHAHIPQIEGDLRARYATGVYPVPAMLIRDHGLTTWAQSPAQAFHHVELLDYIFRYMVMSRLINR